MSSGGARRRPSSDALAVLRLRPPAPPSADDSRPRAAAASQPETDHADDGPPRPALVLDRPAVAGLVLLALVAVAVAGVRLWWSSPHERTLPAQKAVIEAPVVTGDVDETTAVVVVHVAGAVRHPGVVELPAGSRVASAIDQAGGLRRAADPASVNLARPLVDGEQIVVLRRGSSGAGPAPPGAAAPPAGTPGLVRLNSATVQELDALPGIGPVLAERILDWRTAHQRFTSVEELGEVSGIGEATLADLRPLVTL